MLCLILRSEVDSEMTSSMMALAPQLEGAKNGAMMLRPMIGADPADHLVPPPSPDEMSVQMPDSTESHQSQQVIRLAGGLLAC